MNKDTNWVWIDLEMTGLDPEKERIIEIATIVTDDRLNILAEGPELVVHQPQSLLDAMDEWCVKHHGESGLTRRVQESTVTEADAEAQTLKFLQKWVTPGKSPLAGNTIGQDRRFLVKYMPKLEAYMHYRNLDVSTLKILAKSWKPDILDGFTKKNSHRALDDIKESIEELRYYRAHLMTVSDDR